MSYLQLLQRQWANLAFGVLHSASSGFGQTFFVSLFVPALMDAHGIGRASFSSLYAAATLGSSLLLPFAGRGIDVWPARRFSALVALGLALACVTLAGAQGVVSLFVGLLLVRLCGQGLMGHVSGTVVARHFHGSRGTALSLSSLGYPLSETTMPLLATLALARLGYRGALLAGAVAIVVLVLPLGQWLLATSAAPESAAGAGEAGARRGRDWTRAELLRSPAAMCLLPLFNAQAFLLTGLFFHQLALAESKGWSTTLLATSFVAFGVSRAVGSFLVGPLVDRVGAARVLGYGLVPFALGLSALFLGDAPWIAALYLTGAGLSMGATGAARTAYLAETFGLLHLGAIKSFFTMTAVLSTALAPPLFGYWLEIGGAFQQLVLMALGLTVGAGVLGLGALSRLARHASLSAASPI